MSGNVDVGDAIELTFTTSPGADVIVSWIDPYSVPVLDQVTVPETPPGSGLYPQALMPSSPGMWEARFIASGTATAIESFWVRGVAVVGPPPLATVGEVEAQFGALTVAQNALAKALLRAASKIVRQQFPLVDTNVANGKLDPEVVGLAVANMVLRVLRNPRGLRAETTGPFSVTYDTTAAAGELVITPTEVGMLTPRKRGARMVAGTIRVTPGMYPLPRELRRRRGW